MKHCIYCLVNEGRVWRLYIDIVELREGSFHKVDTGFYIDIVVNVMLLKRYSECLII
jgi:hypothetical protein